MLLALVFACLPLLATGQSLKDEFYKTIEKTAGVRYVYQYDNPKQTPAPDGYKPVYISHYGRHGSRWQSSDREYTRVLDIFEDADKAGALSPLGKETLRKIRIICRDAVGLHGGDLSPLGFRQHREIAARMRGSFPEIFQGEKQVVARATTYPRCILSMTAFCDSLKSGNPKLQMTFAANFATQALLNFHSLLPSPARDGDAKKTEWQVKYDRFFKKEIPAGRLLASLFSDMGYARKSVDGRKLMTGLFRLASIMQNVDLDVSLYDVFEREELCKLGLVENFRYYVAYSSSPLNKHYPEYYTIDLLKDIFDQADAALRQGSIAAHFRFGHDTGLMPLAALLRMDNCYAEETEVEKVGEVFRAFWISPMAANLQFVFFKKEHSDDVLVKFLHNEVETRVPVPTDVSPYYHWKDVKKFYNDRMAGMKNPNKSWGLPKKEN
jgi:hypothetical protein